MNYTKRVQNALNYIESNLTDRFDLNDIALEAGCSLFHFHRIFQAATGYSLKEYIRKRRLSEAAQSLRSTHASILEIAFDYGYESQEAFTRAFRKETGINPGEFRKNSTSLLPFPQLDMEYINSVNNLYMDKPRILIIDGFKVIGPAIRTCSDNEENFKRLPEFWDEYNQRKKSLSIPGDINRNKVYGICLDQKGNEFTYMIGVEAGSPEQVPDDMIGRVIPKARYAVFTAKGRLPDSVQNMIRHIYGEWISGSEYSLADSPDFEVYKRDLKNNDETKAEICVPVI